MRLILKLLINAAALWVAGEVISGIDLEGDFWTILLVALIFGLVNTFIKPVLRLLSFPVIIVTIGLFTLVINAAMLGLTAAISNALSIENFWSALLGAVVISIVSAVLSTLVPND
ncbi:MAG: phage holin family protein [Acidimicrobiia bacterium]|nr:phage holin family protein [Acidimicrobiia bacterium]